MKTTINRYEFEQGFKNYNRDYFSTEGYQVLFDYLEELEEDCRIELEFDVIAIVCDYTEYESLEECLNDYDLESLEELEEYTTVLQLENGGIIIRVF